MPNTFLPGIRTAVRAVIFRQGKLLVQVKEKPGLKPYLTLPGGLQDPGETAADALIRECIEEVGAEVTVGPLIHVAEVFKPKAEGMEHRVELLFSCEIAEDYVPMIGLNPDPSQTGTTWASPVKRVSEFRPAYAAALNGAASFYLGVLHG